VSCVSSALTALDGSMMAQALNYTKLHRGVQQKFMHSLEAGVVRLMTGAAEGAVVGEVRTIDTTQSVVSASVQPLASLRGNGFQHRMMPFVNGSATAASAQIKFPQNFSLPAVGGSSIVLLLVSHGFSPGADAAAAGGLFGVSLLEPSGSEVVVQDLLLPLEITLPVSLGQASPQELRTFPAQAVCAYWTGQEYSTHGCLTLAASTSSVTCACSHLTLFTVLRNESLPACGDGIIQKPEACDTGLAQVGCTTNCTVETDHGTVTFSTRLSILRRVGALDSRLTVAGFPQIAYTSAVARAVGLPPAAVGVLEVLAAGSDSFELLVKTQALAPLSQLAQLAGSLSAMSKFSFDGISVTVDPSSLGIVPPLSLPLSGTTSTPVSSLAITSTTDNKLPNLASSTSTSAVSGTTDQESYVSKASTPASNFSTPLLELSSKGSGLETGSLVGIIVGSTLGTAVLLTLVALLWTRHVKKMNAVDLPATSFETPGGFARPDELVTGKHPVVQIENQPSFIHHEACSPLPAIATEGPNIPDLASDIVTNVLPLPGEPGSGVWALWQQSLSAPLPCPEPVPPAPCAQPSHESDSTPEPPSVSDLCQPEPAEKPAEAAEVEPLSLEPHPLLSAARTAVPVPYAFQGPGSWSTGVRVTAAGLDAADLPSRPVVKWNSSDPPSQPIIQCDICLELPAMPGDVASRPLPAQMREDALLQLAGQPPVRSEVIRVPRFDEPSRPVTARAAFWPPHQSPDAADAGRADVAPPPGWYAGFANIIDDVLLQTDPGFADVIDGALVDSGANAHQAQTRQ
jgi:cysteine-rich repeat protein